MADAVLSVELQAQINQYTRNMREAANTTQQTGSKIDQVGGRIASSIGAAFSVAAIVGFGKAVLDATAQYQKFQAVLGNTLGSSALANLKLKELQDFAAKTPFGVNELTGAFVKLANSGFKPVGDEMRKLGDLASSTGKSFDQLAEAIIDAQTGEFERLKEFGIRAKDAGDSVIFTYKGVQTQVEKTSEAIRNYITSLGDAEGTSGAMAKISSTLGGQISNLGDSWDQMLISVGGNTEGVFNSAIGIINNAINKVTQFNKQLQTASKAKLSGGDLFGGRINRMFNPFAKSFNNTERAVQGIQDTEDALNKFVSKTISGAKNVNDFGKALAELQKGAQSKKANFEFIPNSLLDGRDISEVKADYKKESNAIQQAYQDAINAVIDGRKNFNKELNKPSSNFGTGKKDKKGVALIAPKLELPSNSIEEFKKLYRETALQGVPDALKIPAPKKLEIDGTKAKIELGDLLDTTDLDPAADRIYEKLEEIATNARSAIMDIVSLPNLVDVAANTLGSSFEAMGEAIASGGNVLLAAGEVIKKSFADLLSALGQQFITMGAAKVAAGLLATPVGAKLIADGTGLIALGAGLRLGGGIIGNAGGGKGSRGPTAFANGGVVYGPTNALIGEYPGAKSDPEVVAPLSKLKKMLGQTDENGNTINNNTNPMFFEQKVEIDGRKLVVLIRKVEQANSRIK